MDVAITVAVVYILLCAVGVSFDFRKKPEKKYNLASPQHSHNSRNRSARNAEEGLRELFLINITLINENNCIFSPICTYCICNR